MSTLKKTSFICPHCGINSTYDVLAIPKEYKGEYIVKFRYVVSEEKAVVPRDLFDFYDQNEYLITRCDNADCQKLSFWVDGKLVWPAGGGLHPSQYMPEDAKKIFKEAQSVVNLSPRSACALLRVCLERVVDNIGKQGDCANYKSDDKLYNKIKSLNLNNNFQLLCDVCRRAGNENAHSGSLNLDDGETQELAQAMATMINALVDSLIAPMVIAKNLAPKFNIKTDK